MGDSDITLLTLKPSEEAPWRFEDWRQMREVVLGYVRQNAPSNAPLFLQHVNPRSHKLALQVRGVGWETLHTIEVDRTGTKFYSLRPRIRDVAHRLACDVTLEGNVKVITVRSTLQIQNNTMVTMEVSTIDSAGASMSPVQRVGMRTPSL